MYDRLTWDVEELTVDGGLLDQLEKLITETVTTSKDTARHHNTSTSPPPWHAEAGNVLMTIHAGARELENEMRYRISGNTRYRGGSAINTRKALNNVVRLIHGVPEPVAEDVTTRVARWVRQARQIRDIDQAERWVPLPRVPGMMPPPCPYCELYTLRMSRMAGEVRCLNRECRDTDGRRPVARMEYGRLTGDAYLAFGDGSDIVYNAPPMQR